VYREKLLRVEFYHVLRARSQREQGKTSTLVTSHNVLDLESGGRYESLFYSLSTIGCKA